MAPLRASDADRELIHGVLADAFATGRLDRAEYDERSASVLGARTLGDLPPIVADLVPNLPVRSRDGYVPLVAAGPDDIRKRALERYAEHRRHAVLGFLGPTLICWAIWAATSFDGGLHLSEDFPWPLIVMAVTFLNMVRALVTRDEVVAEEIRRLEKKQAKEIEKKRRLQ